MQQQLINHSPDLKQLWDEGYQLEVIGGQHLVVHHIPYLTAKLEVNLGSLVSTLTLATPSRVGVPPDHTMHFIGELPHNADGTPLNAIVNNSHRQQLTTTLTVDHYFSSKPASGHYDNFYQKVRTYAEILSAQARIVDPAATAKPNQSNS